MLALVTTWSVWHVSRGQSVTGVSDYYDTSVYDNDIPVLDPGSEGGSDQVPGSVGEDIRDPYDIPILSDNVRDDSETDPYNVPILGPSNSDGGAVSDPYDIPILSDNVIRTEPEDQQETLPLVTDQVREEEVESGDMCRLAGAGAESIVMELTESRGGDFSQLPTPRQLPVMGQVSDRHISHDI